MTCIKDIEDIFSTNKNTPEIDLVKMKNFVAELIRITSDQDDAKQITKNTRTLNRKYKIHPSKKDIRLTYYKHFINVSISDTLKLWMIKTSMRSASGVLVVTVTLAPSWGKTKGRKKGTFSCSKDCYYCPQETDLEGNDTQPRSYLSGEPAMRRALRSNFDIRGQFVDRINSYIAQGNINLIEEEKNGKKIEVIVSGGTWDCFPLDYRDTVINELYWVANTCYGEDRPMLSLEDETHINETARFRIIGLTLETRPDSISKANIKRYRRYGVTRIQIGIQHYDDEILRKVNRECYTKDTIKAIRLLKQAGLKVVCHLMPDLPGSTPDLDRWMFQQALDNPDLRFDDVKIYPTAICKSSDPERIVRSKIADWYKDGSYVPYAETDLQSLIEVIAYYMANVQPWVRVQRIIRDIPKHEVEAGNGIMPNLRQVIDKYMKDNDMKCNEIRKMEVRNRNHLNQQAELIVRKYEASEGIEYHLSMEAYRSNDSNDSTNIVPDVISESSKDLNEYLALFGFLRLRLDPDPGGKFIREINNAALIREVHVYGRSEGVGSKQNKSSQHRGYGQYLMKVAEKLALQHGYNKIAVIAGVGTREYYKNKCGYHLEGTYMIKYLKRQYIEEVSSIPNNKFNLNIIPIILISYFVIKYVLYYIILKDKELFIRSVTFSTSSS